LSGRDGGEEAERDERSASTGGRRERFSHAEAPALICRRCGSFFCQACLSPTGFCAPCEARQQPSMLAIVAAVVGAISFCGWGCWC